MTPGTRAYVAVGSNVEPRENFRRAMDLLRDRVCVTAVSTVYRTAPLGRTDQPAFLNAVWQVRTTLGPGALKYEVLRPIERQLGRQRDCDDPWGPRCIDLDLVLYGGLVSPDGDPALPADDLDRPFVAWPLLELDADLVLPDTGQSLLSLWADRPRPADMVAEPELTAELRGTLDEPPARGGVDPPTAH